jgi:hypothetical protein
LAAAVLAAAGPGGAGDSPSRSGYSLAMRAEISFTFTITFTELKQAKKALPLEQGFPSQIRENLVTETS